MYNDDVMKGSLKCETNGWVIVTREDDGIYPMDNDCFDMIEARTVEFTPGENGWVSQDAWRYANEIEVRLEYLRQQLRNENISYGELVELQSLASSIEPGDVELLEATGVPEFKPESEIVGVDDSRVIKALQEDDMDSDAIDTHLGYGGDFWVDCDYLVRPNGTVIDFVTVSGCDMDKDIEFAVVHDSEELDDADNAALLKFMGNLERHELPGGYAAPNRVIGDSFASGQTLALTVIPFDALCPKGSNHGWHEGMERWSKSQGRYMVAFRGGCGYSYGTYDMGTL